MAAAGDARDPCTPAPGRFARRHPAVSDVFGDLPRHTEGSAQASHDSARMISTCFAYSSARLRVTALRPPLVIIGTAAGRDACGCSAMELTGAARAIAGF